MAITHQRPSSIQSTRQASYTHLLLTDDLLSDAEKRDILASWASDRRAVADQPGLHVLDDGTVVSIDDILDALKSLNSARSGVISPGSRSRVGASVRRRPSASPRWVLWRQGRRSDDDDDPPPCPAGIARPVGPFPIGGSGCVCQRRFCWPLPNDVTGTTKADPAVLLGVWSRSVVTLP